MCLKKEKRNLLNLFKVFKCEDCKYLNNDEKIMIGNISINYYHLLHCKEDRNPLFENIKLKVLLYEFCKNSKNNILLWEENEICDYDVLEVLLGFNLNVHIICN